LQHATIRDLSFYLPRLLRIISKTFHNNNVFEFIACNTQYNLSISGSLVDEEIAITHQNSD